MSKTIVLYCQEAPGLKLGPNNEITFRDGYADVDVGRYPDWAEWAYHSGTPFIRVLDEGEATSADGPRYECAVDGQAFTTEKALNAHLLGHRVRPPALVAAEVAAAAAEAEASAAITAALAEKEAAKLLAADAATTTAAAKPAPKRPTKPPTEKQIAARKAFADRAKGKVATPATG
jgi:hypothetical protein